MVSHVTGSGDDANGSGEGGVLAFSSPDSPAQVITFYQDKCREMGMKVELSTATHDGGLIVAEDEDGRILGWTHVIARVFLESDPYAELAGLVVDKNARRKGAGQALVSAAETWAVGRGYRTIRVRSNVKRVEARPFYEGRGYVIGKSQHVYEKTLE